MGTRSRCNGCPCVCAYVCACASTSVHEPHAGIYLSALRKCNELHYTRPARCELFRWSSVVLHRDRSEKKKKYSIFEIKVSKPNVASRRQFQSCKICPQEISFDDNNKNEFTTEEWILFWWTCCAFFSRRHTRSRYFLRKIAGLRNSIPSKMIDSIIRDNCYCYGKS